MQLAIRCEFLHLLRIPGLRGVAIALLCVGLTGCQRHVPPTPASQPSTPAVVQPSADVVASMETRSLLPEIDQAKFGAAAQVRTRFGRGSGLVLPAEHEVLAHLHVVLTPKKKIADQIFVNLSASSTRIENELHASAIAQDPTHDLVLLKVGTSSAASQSPAQTQPFAQQKDPHEAHHRHTHRTRRRRLSRADAVGTDNSAAMKKTAPKVKTRVVYDGPDNADNENAQKLGH